MFSLFILQFNNVVILILFIFYTRMINVKNIPCQVNLHKDMLTRNKVKGLAAVVPRVAQWIKRPATANRLDESELETG